MNDTPAISVIVPMYNVEKYLKTCITSILDQTFTDFELILVDDCSTDSTLEIAKSFSDPRIKILQTEKNYAIIQRARAVLLSELALSLRQTLSNWNDREQSYQAQFKELKTKLQIIDTLGLYIDDDGDLAQNDTQEIILPDNVPVTSQDDMQEMLDEIFDNNN